MEKVWRRKKIKRNFIGRSFYSFDWDVSGTAVVESVTLSINSESINDNGAQTSSLIIFKADTTVPINNGDYSKCDNTVGAANLNNVLGEVSFSSLTVDSSEDISLDALQIGNSVQGNRVGFCGRGGGDVRYDPSFILEQGPRLRVHSKVSGMGPKLIVRYRP